MQLHLHDIYIFYRHILFTLSRGKQNYCEYQLQYISIIPYFKECYGDEYFFVQAVFFYRWNRNQLPNHTYTGYSLHYFYFLAYQQSFWAKKFILWLTPKHSLLPTVIIHIGQSSNPKKQNTWSVFSTEYQYNEGY